MIRRTRYYKKNLSKFCFNGPKQFHILLGLYLSLLFPSLTVSFTRIKGFFSKVFSGLIFPVIAAAMLISVLDFSCLVDIVGADFNYSFNTLFIGYPLLSHSFANRWTISTLTESTEWISSIFWIFPNSNWAERENWDMFGIPFFNHPDLRRLLSDYGFKGHPLRKSFPLLGYLEVSYNVVLEYITYVPVSVSRLSGVFKTSNSNDTYMHSIGKFNSLN